MKKQQLFTLEDWSGSDVKIIDHSESFEEIIQCAYRFYPSDWSIGDTLHICLTEWTAEWISYKVEDEQLKFLYLESEIMWIDEWVLWIYGTSIITLHSQQEATLFFDLRDCEICLKNKKQEF